LTISYSSNSGEIKCHTVQTMLDLETA